MNTAIGIDLGTTNSVAAHCEGASGTPEVIPIQGERLTPSVVALQRLRRDSDQRELLVGRWALNAAARDPRNTILSIKRLMGRDFADEQIQAAAKRLNYKIVPGLGEDPRAFVELQGERKSPEEISALILRKIKDEAGRKLGRDVTHAVITVPAYFNDIQRAATRDAGRLAGLVVKKIIDEPTAAAIAFGVQTTPGAKHRLLVFDLGGGTFDISILQMVRDPQGQDHYEVLRTEGDRWCGGDDMDMLIVDQILDWIRTTYDQDPSDDQLFRLQLKTYAEAAKKQLSETEQALISFPSAYRKDGVTVDVDMVITRAEFERLIQPMVDACMRLVKKALTEASFSPEEISDVLLVGGATYTPLVFRAVEDFFGREKVRRTVNPMECVAIGASRLAATQQGLECPARECRQVNDESRETCEKCGTDLGSARAVGATRLGETTPFALGICAVDGDDPDRFVPIIPKSTPYPLPGPMHKSFRVTDEGRIRVPVYEGDEAKASKNVQVGEIAFDLPDKVAAGSTVDVSFNYDSSRLLIVTVSVPEKGFSKTERLRRDHARVAPPQPQAQPQETRSWQEELANTMDIARSFLDAYGTYAGAAAVAKLKRDLQTAQKLDAYPDEVEGRRMTKVLETNVFACGVATQLFLADRMTEGAPPEAAKLVRDAAASVKRAHESGQLDEVASKVPVLREALARVAQQRAGVRVIGDRIDHGGLLRAL